MVCVYASVSLPLHHKVQKFSFGTGSPGWSRKRVVKRLWCGGGNVSSDESHKIIFSSVDVLRRVVLDTVYYRKLHCSMGKQNDVLHRQRIWSRFLICWDVYLSTSEMCPYILFFVITLSEPIVFEVVNLWSRWSLYVAFSVAYCCVCGNFWYLQFILMLFVLFVDFTTTAFAYVACIAIGYYYYLLLSNFWIFYAGRQFTSVTVSSAFVILWIAGLSLLSN